LHTLFTLGRHICARGLHSDMKSKLTLCSKRVTASMM
jgi:hypothetical protein